MRRLPVRALSYVFLGFVVRCVVIVSSCSHSLFCLPFAACGSSFLVHGVSRFVRLVLLSLSFVFLRCPFVFVIRWFVFERISVLCRAVRKTKHSLTCVASFVHSCYFAFSLRLAPVYRRSSVCLFVSHVERSVNNVSFLRGRDSFVHSAFVRRLLRTRLVRFAFSVIVFESSSCRYLVVVYRTDGRFVSSFVVSLIAVPSSTYFVSFDVFVIASLVCVNVGFRSCFLVASASFIVCLAFLEVA